jgi:hypothetical protein
MLPLFWLHAAICGWKSCSSNGSGAIDVNYKEEVYDGKVSFAKILAFFSDFLWFLFFSVQFLFLNSEHHPVYVIL